MTAGKTAAKLIIRVFSLTARTRRAVEVTGRQGASSAPTSQQGFAKRILFILLTAGKTAARVI